MPSRALIQESVYDKFMERCLERIAAIKQGDPLDRETMIGPQVSAGQLEKIESYVKIGLDEGAELLIGGHRPKLNDSLDSGYYFEPTVLKGHNRDAGVPGGDFRPSTCRDDVQGRGRGSGDRQRHVVRPRRRRVDPRRKPRVPHGPRDQSWTRVDQLLPPLPRACRVRRLQEFPGWGVRTIG